MNEPRQKPRQPGKQSFPDGALMDYRRALLTLAAAVEDEVRRAVLPVLPDLRADAVEDIPPSGGWYETIRRAFVGASSGIAAQQAVAKAVEAARAAGRQVDRHVGGQVHKMLRRAYSVDVMRQSPNLADALVPWEAENIRLIKSIPEDALDRMHGKVVSAVRSGEGWRNLRHEIEAEFGATKARSKLIARDQIEKLNGDLTRIRQQDLGVTHYIWRGMMDERERPEHVEREGKMFAWDDPPEGGHPGEAIQCRCYAEPVLPLLADLDVDQLLISE